jgi:hypothetical protein
LTAGVEKNASHKDFFGLKIFLATLKNYLKDWTPHTDEGG